MKIIEYISYLTIPFLIGGTILYASLKKEKVYETFVAGAADGMKLVIEIFPTMLGIIVAINIFRASGALDLIIGAMTPLTKLFNIPKRSCNRLE